MKLKRFPAYIVHEDEHLIAINKPAMISSLHDRIGNQPSIQHLAQDYIESQIRQGNFGHPAYRKRCRNLS
jgi:23S rRNA-/tRNA-specific pseudouridylate synthase